MTWHNGHIKWRSHPSRYGAMSPLPIGQNLTVAREIFAKPKQSIDTRGRRNTKASKYGLLPYIVGTHKAKDLLAGRMKLAGEGAGRMHWYEDVRADYYDQLTGEVKAPHRTLRGKRIWQQKSGCAVEAWDCEVYAMHSSRAARVHLMKPHQWDALEQQLKQADLFTEAAETEEHEQQPPPSKRRKGGFATNWRR